jgi:hypothetical protein
MQDMLEATTNNELTVEDLTGLVLKTGEMGLRAMALLDKANTTLLAILNRPRFISASARDRASWSAGMIYVI